MRETKVYVAFNLDDLKAVNMPSDYIDHWIRLMIEDGVKEVLKAAKYHSVDYSEFTVGMVDGLFVIQVPIRDPVGV